MPEHPKSRTLAQMSNGVLGYPISKDSSDIIIKNAKKWLQTGRFQHITTLNPQIVMAARRNRHIHDHILDSICIVPDGVGVQWAYTRQNDDPINKLAGIDLMTDIIASGQFSIYLVGASKENIEAAAQNIASRYPQTSLLGHHHGYFDHPSKLISDIQHKKPDFIFVGLGCPKQEEFLIQLKPHLYHGIGMGVGGCIDIFADAKKRAPEWMVNSKMEWLYRGITEPKRILNWGYFPSYLWTVLNEK